jgi:hypothetical protein
MNMDYHIEEYLKEGYSLEPSAKNQFLAKFIKNTISQIED